MSLNKAMLIGNLGSDPELRRTNSGGSVLNMNIATTERWNSDGEKQERTEWHRVVCFDKLADSCASALTKGRQVYVEGRIQSREWESDDGEKKRAYEIVANTVRFLGKAPQAAKSKNGKKEVEERQRP